MKPEEIILPSALLAGIPQDTVIQLSVMHQKFFIACWDKIEGILALELDKILSYTHCIYICRFTDEDLAERMRRRRIDLSSAVRKYPEVSWLEIARHNPDPSSFFNWLHREELWPPSSEIHSGSPLLIAAQNDRLPATTWLLYKTFDVRERWECAIGAATRHTAGSTSILECAIKRIALHSAVHPVRWPQNIYSAVIQGASQGAKKNTPEENTVIQHIAIKKMQFLRGHLGYSLLCSKKDMSLLKELDLQEMATFAENQNIIAKAEYEDQKKSLLKQHARLLKDFALKPRRTSTPQ
ncbi:hypothetical protein N7456_006975 [Penicillium angulare]|uniref:Uncharacterized protein n=1 Tax=Penicillium angulare TaxID=116970 RepID=A0A9W9FIW2_9EURO|nr:hypothetical protein N7456_006975 [Penicillium angulare]